MRATVIKLAIFTLFTAAVTALLASVIGNFRPFRSRYTLEAAFDDATGLLRGDVVTLAGVNVGKVRAARVERGIAIVEMVIDESVKLPKTTTIRIRYRNLIGQRVVELSPGPRKAPFYKHDDRVPITNTDGPLDLDMVFNNLRPLVEGFEGQDINTLSKALVTSFGQHKTDIDGIFADVAKITADLAARDQALSNLIGNLSTTAGAVADERMQLQRLLANFADVTEVLADNSGRLDRTLVNLDTSLGDFADLIEGNRPALDQDLKDLAVLLEILENHQGDLTQIAGSLDEVLRATARGTTYGEWGSLFVFSLCQVEIPGCAAPQVSTADSFSKESNGVERVLFGASGGKP